MKFFRFLFRHSKIIISAALLSLPISSAMAAWQPQANNEDEARGAFIKNRNKTAGVAAETGPPTSKPSPGKNRKPVRPLPAAPSTIAAGGPAPVPVRLGLGLTLYQRGERGEALRVSPAKTFQKDDAVRFVIEPNVDGYLYIFHSEGEAEPVMIFPDHRLHAGQNRILAHVPNEVPSRHSKTPWFVFDENAAVENLLIVISKTPLAGVPAGDELLKYCLPFGEDCNWKPAKPQYDVVLNELARPKLVSLHQSPGQLQASIEEASIAKGLKLKTEGPAPTLVQMNVSPALDMLVMKAQLIHR